MKSISKCLILGLGLFTSISAFSATADVVVIVNPSNESVVDASTVEKLFLGKKKSFSDGTPAHVLFQKGDTGEEFTTKVLSRSASQFKAYWAKRAFSGKGKPPKSVSNSSEMKKLVAASPEAIGIIDAADADSSVKIVLSQ